MNKLLVTAFLLFTVACGNGNLDKFKQLKDEVCACKDKACVEAVDKKMEELMSNMKEPSEDEGKKYMEVMTEAAACEAKITK